MTYEKIGKSHPQHEMVKFFQLQGQFACDSVDHNDNMGCSNPRCFKFNGRNRAKASRGKVAGRKSRQANKT